jgi:iron only hydrogenase large subunit-like protein/PAS domain-containing protein
MAGHQHSPIYTAANECQDCSKCVRYCPVKAIKVTDGQARIMPEKCVACGTCVRVCPAGAKRVRDDLATVKHLLQQTKQVFVSLAPSYVSEFPEIPTANMIAALRRLGFAGVSETALGAQQVSARVAKELREGGKKLLLSSACPAAVTYVQKYLPQFADSIAAVFSPLLVHSTMLRQHYGPDIAIVFIGPCGAKKNEGDRHPELLDAVITFTNLQNWFREAGIDPAALVPEAEDRFVPESAREGALYPIEGGMIDTVRMQGGGDRVHYSTVGGLRGIEHVLGGLRPEIVTLPIFLELLACRGGCINGSCATPRQGGLQQWQEVISRADVPAEPILRPPLPDINENIHDRPLPARVYDEQEIRQALRRVGKESRDDELNCGGCGYETCGEFAKAILSGHAESSMCLSYLREQAQKKANALLHSIPSAIVLADHTLKILDCNRNFAQLFDAELLEVYEIRPGLTGAALKQILPFAELFEEVLETGVSLHREALHMDHRIFDLTIFPIEPGQVVGCVITDVTDSELPRELIAQRAQEVIRKNLKTVQEVACLLGENMAETEILLRSLVEGFAPEGSALPKPGPLSAKV